MRKLLFFFLFAVLAAAQTIQLHVDAREAPRRVFHARLTIPAAPGPLTLYYPQWLPGNHRPTGPINNVVELRFQAAGKPVAWRRDDVNMYAFHCDVPAGANSVEVSFDYVTPSRGPGRFDPASTDQLMIFNWNLVTLYPAGKPAADYTFQATLDLPVNWKFGTPLRVAGTVRVSGETPNRIQFEPVSLVTLIDSPVVAGAHYRMIPLTSPGAPPQELDIAADTDSALELSPDLIDRHKRLVAEAAALFGAHHYSRYHFLITLTDVAGGSGLEHHESSDDRMALRAFIDPDLRKLSAGLLPHEFVHSWNGKYRRPAGLATPNYQEPMKGELLWVYEGLTSYLGDVLTARSGLWTSEQFRDSLADTAASLDHEAGRKWRPLADTAISVQSLSDAPREWSSLRRSLDYYAESVLIWLEADTIIRRESNGRHSLDDFCREFFGPPSGPPALKTYTLDDVIAALNHVQPHDWAGFFRARVYEVSPRAPLGGIEQGGWKLEYNDTPSDLRKTAETRGRFINLTDSLGMSIARPDGNIGDVISGMAAAQAGISPGMKLVAVNSRAWSPENLMDALRARQPFDLLVDNDGVFKTVKVDYRDGLRSPHLVRNSAAPDLLGDIIKAKAPISLGP
jgi:predicted metalloprotease with PDZ domain